MRILLIEDDELLSQQLVNFLTSQNYTIDVASNGIAGLEQASLTTLTQTLSTYERVPWTYDLILLDIMLPQLDGISICQQLRELGIRTPILLLTGEKNNANKAIGLDAGADDYLTKPFDWKELSARIRALLRRGKTEATPILQWGDLHLDPSNCQVTYQGLEISLTPKEYSLLELFLRNKHRVFSRSAILDRLWSFETSPGEETITAHIKGLRQKLKKAGLTSDPIETVYGIGYRLRELENPSKKSKPRKSISPDLEKKAIEAAIVVWQRVKEKLSSRVATIEQATTAILNNKLGDELRQQSIVEAHKLAGSLGMFDLDEGSRLAREIEQIFQKQAPLNQEQRQHLSQLMTAMRRELKRATQEKLPDSLAVEKKPLLLIVEKDKSLAQQWATEVANRGMLAEIVQDATAAREWISQQLPHVVLLDLTSTETFTNDLTLVGELSACTPPVPVLVLTDRDGWLDRVRIARLGGRWFLQKPLSANEIVEAVNQVLQRTQKAEAKVMVVDDDPLMLETLHDLLEPWGIKLFTLEEPLQFWPTFEAVLPNLLILDVEMPQLSGIELCQVVRNDLRWAELPILFLTAHTDAETRQRVFEVGADDYVSKPIVVPELVTRILNRLERSRLLRNLAETDVLTRVSNRRQSTQDLNQLLQLAERSKQPLCFALIDLDRLKQINDQYEYAVGDRVLSRFGELLRRNFRSEDVVARWGGAEFVVGMYGMNRSEGVQRITDLLEILRKETFATSNSTQLQVTFSAAVVEYLHDGVALTQMYQVAKALLLQAKAAGGNLILCSN
jgi:diguanylate cyclase (GGDEF)-like protein